MNKSLLCERMPLLLWLVEMACISTASVTALSFDNTYAFVQLYTVNRLSV